MDDSFYKANQALFDAAIDGVIAQEEAGKRLRKFRAFLIVVVVLALLCIFIGLALYLPS